MAPRVPPVQPCTGRTGQRAVAVARDPVAGDHSGVAQHKPLPGAGTHQELPPPPPVPPPTLTPPPVPLDPPDAVLAVQQWVTNIGA
jgi:hypothetical protein